MYCLHNSTGAKSPLVETLKKRQSFKQVYSRGRYAANSLFVVYALANKTSSNKIGFTVTKKIGNAVVRNRIRRWLKESVRLTASDLKQGYDLVIIARGPMGVLPKDGAFKKVNESIMPLFKRLGL